MKLPQSFKKPKKRKLLLLRRVVGDSMLPFYKPGYIVIARGVFNRLEIGDVVIVCHGGLEKIKRVQNVKNGRIFVVGDNEARSVDSRSFGWLGQETVIGKVVWPRRKNAI